MATPAPQVLYLDNHLLVLDKPWGMLTQPSGTGEASLEEWGKGFLKERFGKPGRVFLEAVHRIDRVVGGVVLFARTSKALSRLNECQRAHGFEKEYRALVWGTLKERALPGEGELRHWLLHGEHAARLASPGEADARECALRYASEAILPGGTELLRVRLLTGRYHQIRAQLAAAGLPLCGDGKYGAPEASRQATPAAQEGIGLLSFSLSFPHPVTRQRLHVETRLSLLEGWGAPLA